MKSCYVAYSHCWAISSFLHSPGWHAAFSSFLNPLPSWKQKANEEVLFGMFPLLVYWPGWHAALQRCLEPIPTLETAGT